MLKPMGIIVRRSTWKWVLPLASVLLLSGACRSMPGPGEAGDGFSGVRGRVYLSETGQPVQGAHVYAYTDYSKNLIGVADHLSRGSEGDGSYRLNLPPGKYYLVARKRVSGSNYGPIVTGDLYDHRFEQEAVNIERGTVLEKDFQLEKLSEPMFFQVFTENQRRTATGIRGRIIDQDGQPVQGAFATAYGTSDMKRLPDFASTLTGDGGEFTLYLPSGGKWFIGARSHARAAPRSGEPVGRYEGTGDHSVQVKENSFLEGVEIVLKPFSSTVPEGYSPY